MFILGLSAFRHDSAAVMLEDGAVKWAIEDEKLTRSLKEGLPDAAISFCLKNAGITWTDIDAIAIGSRPVRASLRRLWLRAKWLRRAPISSAYYGAKETGSLAREWNTIRILKQRKTSASPIYLFDHHLCHAAAAFLESPFDPALVITLDEDGDAHSGIIAVGSGTNLRLVQNIVFPHSLAWAYTQVTQLIGFRPHRDEHKTQWLSLQGEPTYKNVFLELLRRPNTFLPRLNSKLVNRGLAGSLAFSSEFYHRIGLPNKGTDFSDDLRRSLACSIQQACTEIVNDLVTHFLNVTKMSRVCLSGGLFQNSLLVSSLEEKLGTGRIFVPPAPGNPGTAVGAALLAWYRVSKKPRSGVSGVFCGPKFNPQEIKEVLDNTKTRYSLHNTELRTLDATVKLLEAGKIVGWYQGAAEFGPRALGNRSILASPWAAYVQDNLNDYIKHREWFRPFAIAVPEEDCPQYFVASPLCQFMNSLGRIRPNCNPLPQDFWLRGGRIRLQIVERRSNPLFWQLLKRFGEHAPAPLLVNTSFNLFSEPLVVTPRDALRSYFCSGLDALVIDHFVLSKSTSSPVLATHPQVEGTSLGARA